MKLMVAIGDRVWWTDPDADTCSGRATVAEVVMDGTYIISMDEGELVIAEAHELTTIPAAPSEE